MAERKPTKYRGVYQRKSDTRNHLGKPDVCYDITYKHDGKKVWEKVGWESEGYSAKLAEQVRAERIRSIRHNQELPTKKKAPFFKEAAAKYLEWAKENKTRNGRDEKSRYEKHLASQFCDTRLDQITSFDLEKFKKNLLKKGLSPATVAHCLKIVRQIYNKAKVWGIYTGENPIHGVKMPSLQNERQRFLTHEEADLLVKELAGNSPQLHDISLLSLHTGIRAGEIFNLKMQDIDFNNDLIRIADPKNKQARTVYMTHEVKKMLKRHYKPECPEELVFKDHKGNKIREVSRSFEKVVKDLKLNDGVTDPRQKVVFHTLRHTFASWLAIQGESLITMRDLLGHKTTTMTNRYSHLIPDHKKKAVLKLERNYCRKLSAGE